jgi:ATP-dependent Lon protease
VPEQAKNELEFFFVRRMDEVLNLALEKSPFVTAPVPAESTPTEVRA